MTSDSVGLPDTRYVEFLYAGCLADFQRTSSVFAFLSFRGARPVSTDVTFYREG